MWCSWDADPQASASAWASVRTDAAWPVVSLPPQDIATEALSLAQRYDHVIIDGPPGAVAITRAIIVAADLVLIPMVPSGLSRWSADITMRQISQAVSHRPELQAAIVISLALPRTTITKVLRANLIEAGMPVLATTIVARVAQAEATSLGMSIYEYQPRGAAAREISQLADEIGEQYAH